MKTLVYKYPAKIWYVYLRQILLLCSWLFFITESTAQGYDRFWVCGYDYWNTIPNNPNFGGSYIDFNEEPPRVYYDPAHEMNFWGTAATISDSSGTLLFYSNGQTIHDADHGVVAGGDTIGYGDYWEIMKVNGRIGGAHFIQGAFFLPDPSGDQHEYWLIYAKADIRDTVLPEMSDILLTQIRKTGDDWIVVNKDELILHDTLYDGELAVCRHANGRDWWLLTGEKNSSAYYKILLDPHGPRLFDKQDVGSLVYRGAGQAGFVADGRLFYRFEGYWFGDDGGELHLYDFDRCSGQLSNHRFWVHPSYNFGGAVGSQDGRFLYTTDAVQLYQFDLLAPDIEASMQIVAIYDGYVDQDNHPTHFSFLMRGADGKIYSVPPTGSSRTMHTIELPHLQGVGCQVRQHSIVIPTHNQRSVNMVADFRLGPLDGSTCDTLQIDNVPVANFRAQRDSADLSEFNFIDLSYHEPQTWHWDFGDGQTSSEQYSQHTYLETGYYNVCLTVENHFGNHTICKEVFAEQVNPTVEVSDLSVMLYPNPVEGLLHIDPVLNEPLHIEIVNAAGLKIIDVEMSCPCSIVMSSFPLGMYGYKISDGARITVGTIVKM